jgi:hypothetical protein
MLAAHIAEGKSPSSAVTAVLGDLSPNPLGQMPSGSVYEIHRQTIIDTYHQSQGNVSKLEHVLQKNGIRCSRRGLAQYLELWGIRRIRHRKRKEQ